MNKIQKYRWKRSHNINIKVTNSLMSHLKEYGEILNKDFLTKKAFITLGPNYMPPNPCLAMNFRSSNTCAVREHGVVVKTAGRKFQTKLQGKDKTKIGKELTKLINNYSEMNLRNESRFNSPLNYDKSAGIKEDAKVNEEIELVICDSNTEYLSCISDQDFEDNESVPLRQDSSRNIIEPIEENTESIFANNRHGQGDYIATAVDLRKQKLGDYFKKWQDFVRFEKNERKKAKLETFFKELVQKQEAMKEKKVTPGSEIANKTAKDFISYQHRYQIQKHIIEIQKKKIREQNRLIEQLKYNKLLKATNNSLNNLKDEVDKRFNEFDPSLKPQLKMLNNELKIQTIEASHPSLSCLKVPQFLIRMEERARERAEKHAQIIERRIQIEEERMRLKQQQEISKLEIDKEEKQRRIEEMKIKRKQEREESKKKKRYRERMRALNIMADLHYERKLLDRFGVGPWKQLLFIKKYNAIIAEEHFQKTLVRNAFYKWFLLVKKINTDREKKANQHANRKLIERSMNILKKEYHEAKMKIQVADDYYDLYITCLSFRKWKQYVRNEKEKQDNNWKTAIQYHNSVLLMKALNLWRTFPALIAIEREREARKIKWRQRVLSVLPDYKPPENI